MRRGCEKFDANALAFVRSIPDENDAGFLLFLRKGVGDNDDGIHVHRLIQVQQAAVGIDDDGFAGFAEAAIVRIFSGHNHTNAHEDAGAAAGVVHVILGHGKSMLRQSRRIVNNSVCGMFPRNNGAKLEVQIHVARALQAAEKTFMLSF
jgi:hypothetical protein